MSSSDGAESRPRFVVDHVHLLQGEHRTSHQLIAADGTDVWGDGSHSDAALSVHHAGGLPRRLQGADPTRTSFSRDGVHADLLGIGLLGWAVDIDDPMPFQTRVALRLLRSPLGDVGAVLEWDGDRLSSRFASDEAQAIEVDLAITAPYEEVLGWLQAETHLGALVHHGAQVEGHIPALSAIDGLVLNARRTTTDVAAALVRLSQALR